MDSVGFGTLHPWGTQIGYNVQIFKKQLVFWLHGMTSDRFTDTPITDEALEIISKVESLERLFIVNFEVASRVTHHGVRKLSALKRVKQITVDLTEMPPDFQMDMRALLPKCDVHIGVHVPEAKK